MLIDTRGEEKVVIVTVIPAGTGSGQEEMMQEEMKGLVEAAGGIVLLQVCQQLSRPRGATYIGTGKLEELKMVISELQPDRIVFGGELTPVQVRNLEKELGMPVVDRTMLVLDIFKRRAHTREAMLQVELARLEYLLPRLTGKGKELSRTGAGIGTRGSGEQVLELDRRRVRKRIQEIRRQLENIEKTRLLHRQRRSRVGFKVVSLVGYTNAGKSSLFNSLCQAAHSTGSSQVEADSRLFQTLDTTTRKLRYAGHEFLVTDTVGFIQSLPHHLVAAFRSTLAEAIEADLLLHVVDVADPAYLEKIAVVEQVLEELGVEREKILTVFNKTDLCLPNAIKAGQGIAVSAQTGKGIEDLLTRLVDRLF